MVLFPGWCPFCWLRPNPSVLYAGIYLVHSSLKENSEKKLSVGIIQIGKGRIKSCFLFLREHSSTTRPVFVVPHQLFVSLKKWPNFWWLHPRHKPIKDFFQNPTKLLLRCVWKRWWSSSGFASSETFAFSPWNMPPPWNAPPPPPLCIAWYSRHWSTLAFGAKSLGGLRFWCWLKGRCSLFQMNI